MFSFRIAQIIGLTNVGVWIWALSLINKNLFEPSLILGSLSLLVDITKNTLKIPRPKNACACDAFGIGGESKSYGMPSGHVATTVAGWYLISQYTNLFSIKPIYVSLIAGSIMTWARYSVGCHTIIQGIAGMLLGLGWVGLVWFGH
jgi:membrane-associated phospholipid phosphatase